jgi:pentose-5-phosphate-3-epimerase
VSPRLADCSGRTAPSRWDGGVDAGRVAALSKAGAGDFVVGRALVDHDDAAEALAQLSAAAG